MRRQLGAKMVEGFGFRKHERVRQRDRRERQKHERRERERHEQREIAEEHALEEEVQRRLVDGDLREKVAARVAEALATDEVQARVSARCDAERARRITVALDAIETERVERIRAAQQREEDRLSEARELQDILRENERKVNAEKRRREEAERHEKQARAKTT